MDQRVRFIADYQRRFFSLAELCTRFGVSRKTAYKWIERYEIEGASGLEDRSRRPHSCPHQGAVATPSGREVAFAVNMQRCAAPTRAGDGQETTDIPGAVPGSRASRCGHSAGMSSHASFFAATPCIPRTLALSY